MSLKFDLIVLSAANSGQVAANIVRQAGQSVVLIESPDPDGVCSSHGHVPKKLLAAAVETMHHVNLTRSHHMQRASAFADWKNLIAYEHTTIDEVPQALERERVGHGLKVVHGQARFVDRHTVAVNGEHYEGRKILIAAGSKPDGLSIPGFEHVVTGTDILLWKTLPRSLVFIGGDVLAFELAHLIARFGVKVTILEILPLPLPLWDEAAVKKLLHESRRLGVEILTEVETETIVKRDDHYEVVFRYYDTTHTVSADVVANGTGRIADVDELDLDVARVERDRRGIITDDHLRSKSNPDLFAAGAESAAPELSALAAYEGRVVANNLTHEEMIRIDYTGIPNAIFTVPALASVGLTEAAASENEMHFEARLSDMRDWRSGKTQPEAATFAKVLVERKSDKILGAHILGYGAPEIINIFAFAMKHGITAKELSETVYVSPAFASDIEFMV